MDVLSFVSEIMLHAFSVICTARHEIGRACGDVNKNSGELFVHVIK
jgi:hypothetical protein